MYASAASERAVRLHSTAVMLAGSANGVAVKVLMSNHFRKLNEAISSAKSPGHNWRC